MATSIGLWDPEVSQSISLDILPEKGTVEVVTDSVVHKALLDLWLTSRLMAKHHIVIPLPLHLDDSHVHQARDNQSGTFIVVSPNNINKHDGNAEQGHDELP